MTFCSQCGSSIDDGARFCGSCGKGVESKNIPLSKITLGSAISCLGSLLSLVFYFFPWVNILGSKFNGLLLAFQDKPITLVVLIVPLTAITILIGFAESATSKTKQRKMFEYGLIGGILSLVIMFWLYFDVKSEMGRIGTMLFTEYFWFSVVASIILTVGCFREVRT